MIEEGIVALLLADAGVTALIGRRITALILPQDSTCYPALTFQNIASLPPQFALDGTEVDMMRLQFDAFGRSYGEAKRVLNAVRNVLNAFAGVLSDGSRILFSYEAQSIDHFENNTKIYRSLSEYVIEFVDAP